MDIRSAVLTTCGVLDDGEIVRPDLVDDKGATVSLRLPFDRAQAERRPHRLRPIARQQLVTVAVSSFLGSWNSG